MPDDGVLAKNTDSHGFVSMFVALLKPLALMLRLLASYARDSIVALICGGLSDDGMSGSSGPALL